MNQIIEEKVKAYYEAKVNLDFQKNLVEILGKELKQLLQKEGITKETTANGYEVSLVNKTTIKYKDELALKDYLKTSGNSNFLVESIDNKKLNAEIKNSISLKEKLSKFIEETNSDSLLVKEVK